MLRAQPPCMSGRTQTGNRRGKGQAKTVAGTRNQRPEGIVFAEPFRFVDRKGGFEQVSGIWALFVLGPFLSRAGAWNGRQTEI